VHLAVQEDDVVVRAALPTLAPNGTGLTPRKVVADLARMVFCY
jgi:hypothetical protein